MPIAFSGLGRMGGAVADRLRSQGFDLRVYDVASAVRERFRADGFTVCESLTAAAAGADAVFTCLPDANAVESSVEAILQASPPPRICVDLTSSVPEVTRRLGARLAEVGIDMLDAPVSGGVAGARSGRLTSMLGGEPATLERARPWLDGFAATILWAGPLGSGHAVKALNNALSATALTCTSEMLVTALGYGLDPATVVDAFNDGPARTQNSEVKFTQQILPRTFAAGFTAGLMTKDIGIACQIAAAADVPVPLTALLRERWVAFASEHGADADFTRIQESVEQASGAPTMSRGPAPPALLSELVDGTAMTCAIAAWELLNVARQTGMDLRRVLSIVNASSGRSEATRVLYERSVLDGGSSGWRIAEVEAGLSRAAARAREIGASVPTLVAANQIARIARASLGADTDFRELAALYATWSPRSESPHA